MANHIEGRTVVITGAGGGFGRRVAQKTAARGANVVISDVDEATLAETRDAVAAAGGVAEAVVADVTQRRALAAVAERAVDRFGTLDVMVNNAGVMPLAFYADHAEAADAWDRCIDINFKGVLNGIIAVHDAMGPVMTASTQSRYGADTSITSRKTKSMTSMKIGSPR